MSKQLSQLIDQNIFTQYTPTRVGCKCKNGSFESKSYKQHLRTKSHRAFVGYIDSPKKNPKELKITIEDSIKSDSISITAIMYRRMQENKVRVDQDIRRNAEDQIRVVEDTRRAIEDGVRSKEDQDRREKDRLRTNEDSKIFYNLRSGSAFRMAK